MQKRWILAIWWAWMVGLTAQEVPPVQPPVNRSLLSLNAVADPLAASIEELNRLTAELKTAESEERRSELTARIESERERVRQLRENFRDIVGGTESSAFEEAEEVETTLQDQFSELLDPLVGALREPTSRLRETEEMRKAYEIWSDRLEKARRVVERIDVLLEEATDPRVITELQSARRIWVGRQSEAAGRAEVLRLQIEERERNTPTVWESLSQGFGEFLKNRGLNLLLAFVVGAAGFIGVRRAYRWLRTTGPMRRKEKTTLLGRVSDVLAVTVAVLTALIGVLLVFFLRGDWLLLTLVVVLLIAAAWGGKTALPPYVDQIRMLLNLGIVREGERLIYNGLPWNVKSLGFYTTFANPALDGGELRIPLRSVMEMISRVADPKEPWFPTHQGDWTILTDGSYGKVIRQTPEQVILLKLGGSLKTYPTTEFLTLMPENLSRGFRVTTVFGIDYSHQPIATTEVLEVLRKALEEGLVHEFGHEKLISLKVEFQSAGASSLDYAVLADFDGKLGHRYRYIERKLQHMCVDVCNARGWIIPFTQITVHQAPAE